MVSSFLDNFLWSIRKKRLNCKTNYIAAVMREKKIQKDEEMGKKEHSAGVVLYRQMKEHREYLLLHYPGGHYDFPKGHLEENESEREAAFRELEEETGIRRIIWIEGFKYKIDYFFRKKGKLVPKDVVYFLARTTQKKVTLSDEHQGALWVPYNEAQEIITFKNTKKILLEAEKFLN
jgi:bis(5'-nucleosidyl)-tetraphosphatase